MSAFDIDYVQLRRELSSVDIDDRLVCSFKMRIPGSKGFEGGSVYGAAKADIRSFVRNWTVDLKNRKI